MIRRDLKRAGVPFEDDSGARADFHSLRHSYVSRLVRAGVNPKVCQTLARHGSIGLTMDAYSHVPLESQVDALKRLPRLPRLR